jgi:hypothetical protein
MTDLRRTPVTEEMGQDETETFQRIADTAAGMGQIMRARMFVHGRMAALGEWRDGEAPAKPKPADVPA